MKNSAFSPAILQSLSAFGSGPSGGSVGAMLGGNALEMAQQLAGPQQSQAGGIMSMLFGNSEDGTIGALAPTASALTGLAGSYLGMKQYGLAKKAFRESKRQFQLNFDAQKQDYNTKLKDRQRARINNAGTESRYKSVGEYMNKNGI